jgi:hypothetical protein
MEQTRDILVCECHSTEHQLVVFYSEDEVEGVKYPMCYFHVHLKTLPFWQRVGYAFRYIFGRKSRYGAFDEFIFDPVDAEKLQNLVNYLQRDVQK